MDIRDRLFYVPAVVGQGFLSFRVSEVIYGVVDFDTQDIEDGSNTCLTGS